MSRESTHIEHEKDPETFELEVASKEPPSTAYVSQGEKVPRTAAEKSLLLKADLLIVPLIALLYLVSYLVSST